MRLCVRVYINDLCAYQRVALRVHFVFRVLRVFVPMVFFEQVAAHGRRMVTIVDPHIKRDNNYPVHKEAANKGLYIKDKDGKVSQAESRPIKKGCLAYSGWDNVG